MDIYGKSREKNNAHIRRRTAEYGLFDREATTGFEPVIKVLQTHALPLGYVAI